MALYRIGTAAMDAQGVITGTGTKWREPLALIRTGATIVFLTSPLKLAVISEIVSDTEMKAIQTDGEPVANGNYVILLNDSLTVDGMAQDVAETLRYYQSKETVIEEAIEFFKNFDLKALQDLVNQIKDDAAKVAADRAATEQLKNDTQAIKNAAVAETNQIKSDTDAIKNQTQQIKDSAVTEITGIKNEALDARDEAENAQFAAEQSKVGADNAKSGAETARDEARQWAQQVNPENLLHKDQNLADLPDKAASRKNLALDRVSQFPSETLLRAPATATYFTVGGASWGVYDSINATWKPLAVAQGGTGAKTVDEAKRNLSVDRIRQDPTVTHLFTQNKRYSVVMDNNGKWGGYDSTDGVYVPLRISEGGTGAQNARDVRINLEIDRLVQQSDNSSLRSNDSTFYIYLNDGRDWGAYDSTARDFVPLPINRGGTGEKSVDQFCNANGVLYAAPGMTDWNHAGSTMFARAFTGSTNSATGNVQMGLNIPHSGSPHEYVFQIAGRNAGYYARTKEAGTWKPWVGLTTYAVSDETVKNIKGNLNVEGALDNINRMDFKIFSYLSDGPERSYRRGVVSQQIRKIDREYTKEIGGILHLDQTPMLLDGLAAIKALRARDELRKEIISSQQEEINTLRNELDELKKLVNSMINGNASTIPELP